MTRFIHVLSFSVFAFLLSWGYFVAWGQRPEPPSQPNQRTNLIAAPQSSQGLRTQRIREGTAFKDMHVFFRQIGDRTALFTVEDNQRFMCHENLTLERILTTIQDKPERQFWKISGEFAEFRGENFVFIRRAVAAPAPTAVVP